MDENEGVQRSGPGKLSMAGAAAVLALLIGTLVRLITRGVEWGVLALALIFWVGLTIALFVAAQRGRCAVRQSRQESEENLDRI